MGTTPNTADVIIVGNGILGTSLAVQLAWKSPDLRVTQIGGKARAGSATTAAAAMLNSFAEVDTDTLQFPILKHRFELNRLANRFVWEKLLARISDHSGVKIHNGFGTYVINNSKSGIVEDENFDAIIDALGRYGSNFEWAVPRDIPNYQPTNAARAIRAIYINDEGWVNPVEMLSGLDSVLTTFESYQSIDAEVSSLKISDGMAHSVVVSDGSTYSAPQVVIANGASMSNMLVDSGLSNLVLPVYFGVGVTAVLETGELTLANCIRTPNRGLACGLYSAPRSKLQTVIGATNAIWDKPQSSPTSNNLQSILKNAQTELNVDFARVCVSQINLGWRPLTEDLMPMIGETEIPGLFILNGMRRDGFHCSPVVSDIMSDLLLSHATCFDMKPFQPRRKPLSIFTRSQSIDRIVAHTVAAAVEHGFESGSTVQSNRVEAAIRHEAEVLHDYLDMGDRGLQPEFFTYLRSRRLREIGATSS